ncbi:MAG: hypothetical protein RJA07_2303 [Bacteroidota bacterium]|jgi:hypothetical protein
MTFNISIPQPCHEDWSKMTPNENGKFCSACQTVVTDFTLMSNAEIIHHLKTATGKQCGRFNSFQLNRDLIEEEKSKAFFWSIPKFSVAASIVFSLLQLNVKSVSAKEVKSNVEWYVESDSTKKTNQKVDTLKKKIDANELDLTQGSMTLVHLDGIKQKKYFWSWKFPFIHKRKHFIGCPRF